MSKYTTEVRFIVETFAGLKDVTEDRGQDDVNNLIALARPKIFNFTYPIFTDTHSELGLNHKDILEPKILKRYYTREIGAETVGLWQLWLDERLNSIMPYYNQLYESELLKFNPLYDVDLTKTNDDNTKTDDLWKRDETSKTIGSQEYNDSHSSNDNQWQLYSDTPQNGLQNITGVRIDLQDYKYLTNITNNTDSFSENSQSHTDSQVDGTNNQIGTDDKNVKFDGLEKLIGKRGSASYSKYLEEYRKTFLNIDKMIVDELSDLFMQIW